ncbi:DNA recombination protein RmuC [bacterium]|nr:DNA recombination protein RmuC [bacterium]
MFFYFSTYCLDMAIQGLKNGVHFSTQGGYKDDDGKLKKPDFVISLPDNKHLIIDSKVSLTAYVEYYNADFDSLEIIGDSIIFDNTSNTNYKVLNAKESSSYIWNIVNGSGNINAITPNSS